MSVLMYPIVLQTVYEMRSATKCSVSDAAKQLSAGIQATQQSGSLETTLFQRFQSQVSTAYPELVKYVHLGVETLAAVMCSTPKPVKTLPPVHESLWLFLLRYVVQHPKEFLAETTSAYLGLEASLEGFIDMYTQVQFDGSELDGSGSCTPGNLHQLQA